MINSIFSTQKLGKLCSKIGSGATPRGGSQVYLDSGEIALIRSQNVRNEYFSKNGLVYIEKIHADQLANVTVEPDDVLLNITGDSVARCCQVAHEVIPARVNQHVAIIRPVSAKLNPRFLRYFFISPEMQNHMLSLAGAGATRNALTKIMIESFDVPVPDLSEQKAIAHILGSLDDKIELNRKMNETLEAMAQAMFKSLFIDFDPVLDNAILAGNFIPEEFAERAEMRRAILEKNQPSPNLSQGERNDSSKESSSTAGRSGDEGFPSEFIQTDKLGWIPKGWKVGKIKDIADNPKRSIKPDEMESGTPYIGLQDMPQRSIALSSWGYSDDIESPKYSFIKGEILFGKLRPYFHKVGIAPVDGVCSTDILVVVPKADEWFSVVLGHITSVDFIDFVTSASTGTRMPRTNWRDMARYQIAIPSKTLAEVLTRQLNNSISKITLNIEQARELSKLRDTLLPKLLSGEIRIKDAEKLVEGI